MNTPRRRNDRAMSKILRAVLICSLLSAFILSAPATHATPAAPIAGGFELMKLPPEALMAPVELGAPEATIGGPKMEAALSELAATSRASKSDALALAESRQLRLSSDRVQILITTGAERADAATDAVTAVGGEVTGRANGDTWLQAWAPVTALETIAADPSIDYVSRPGEALTMATTEGSGVINAPAWHASGKTGAGVRVAIIDGGFQGYPSLLGGDLPATVTVKNFVDGENDSQVNGTTVHGTACAEVIHDVAPAAALYLVKVGTNVDLEEAVNWAKTQNVNIISTSLGWYNMAPGDGTGFFADLVQSARSAGIFWTTAAGNDREAHWGGAFNGNSSGYHQFAGTQAVDFFGAGDGSTAYMIPAGYPIRVFLRWDDWSAKNQDFDLFVVRWNGSTWQIVGSSETRQTGGTGHTPTEYVGVLTSGSTTAYGFAIKTYSSSRNVNLEVFAPKVARLDKIVTARSLANLADSPGAMTVAALDVSSPYAQESYSSEGPANGSGGIATGGATKPDISGFANVSTSSYPDPSAKFNGTSSATPHVAGAAALVKSAYPAYTPAQIQSFLEGRAVDMGASGKDTLFGWGRLNLGAPPGGGVVLSRKTFLPKMTKPLDAPAPAWNTILADSFEGPFPGGWQLRKFGSYDWGKSSCRSNSGGYSAWAVGGSGLPCGANYPDSITPWMVYGPFSLADATAADLKFKLWSDTELDYDGTCAFASVDNDKFYGSCWTGNSNGWRDLGLDLASVYQIGDLRGRPQVWITFLFDTDDTNNYAEGAYVDDVVLRKCVGGQCAGVAASAESFDAQFKVAPAVMERPE